MEKLIEWTIYGKQIKLTCGKNIRQIRDLWKIINISIKNSDFCKQLAKIFKKFTFKNFVFNIVGYQHSQSGSRSLAALNLIRDLWY